MMVEMLVEEMVMRLVAQWADGLADLRAAALA